MNEISKKIHELRKSLKLTQSQFAELVHLSEDSIGKIERGVGIPTVETLDKIANALKVPIEDLMRTSRNKKLQRDSKEVNDLTAYLQTRTPADVRLIHELAVKILERKK